MTHPGPLDVPFVALMETVALAGCEARMTSLGMPTGICNSAERAQATLDLYDFADDEQGSTAVTEFIEDLLRTTNGLSRTQVIQVGLRLSKSFDAHDAALFAWSVLLEHAVAGGIESPPGIEPARLRLAVDKESGWAPRQPPGEWDRRYLARHPFVAPDEAIEEIWTLRKVATLLAEVGPGSPAVHLVDWAQSNAQEIGMDSVDLSLAVPSFARA